MSRPPRLTGEWFAGCASPSGRQIIADHSNGESYCIATVHAGNDRDYESIALKMAAAEELFSALESATELLRAAIAGDFMPREPDLKPLCAALAKASGS